MKFRAASILVLSFWIADFSMDAGGQTRTPLQRSSKSSENVGLKRKLQAAVDLSKKQKRVTIRVDVKIQGREVVAHYCFSAPDRYHTSDTENGKILKEAIEISGQRYQRKGDEWIKVRKDPYPLREQADVWFPIKLVSSPSDAFKVGNVKVTELASTEVSSAKKYRYEVTYNSIGLPETGVAWVSDLDNLLQRLETGGHGLFGLASSVWVYDYASAVSIEPPAVFVERDWIN